MGGESSSSSERASERAARGRGAFACLRGDSVGAVCVALLADCGVVLLLARPDLHKSALFASPPPLSEGCLTSAGGTLQSLISDFCPLVTGLSISCK